MKFAWIIALLILGAVSFGLIGHALAQNTSDPVKQELDAAKATHTAALSKATTSLAAAFDAQIRSLANSGDADSAKLLSTQKSAFISAGTLPQSPLMKQAVAQYQQAVKDADDKLAVAYTTAIEGFNKESRLDLATQARKERSDLLAPPVGGATGGNSSGAIPTPEAIAKELEAAKTQNRQDIDDAKKALLDTIDQRINAATDAGNLALVQALQSVQATAAVDGTVPDNVKDAAVVVAKKTYDAALATAKSKLNLAYQKAVRDYTRARQIALAQSTQNELNSLGLVDATAPTAMTAGTYQLASKLPDFSHCQDSVFVPLGDQLGILVPQMQYIRTKENDLLNKNFTFDVWFYMVKGMKRYVKLQAAMVGLGEGTANPVNGGPLDSLYLEINPPDQNGGEVNLHQRQITTKRTIGHLKEFDTVARIQKSGNSVTFIVGTEQSGTLVPEVSITIGDVRADSPYLNDTNGHLFFGSGAFRQLSIGKGPAPVVAIAGATPLTEGSGGAAARDSVAGATPPVTANTPPNPARNPGGNSGATAAPGAANQNVLNFALIADAVKNKSVVETEKGGGNGGHLFEDIPADGAVLVGFITTQRVFSGSTVIGSIQPVYRNVEGRVDGEEHGRTGDHKTTVVAKTGYAVGGVVAKGGDRLDGFQIVFMKIKPDNSGLDPKDSYLGDWMGGKGGARQVRLGGTGKLVVGVFGYTGDDFDSFGLVTMP